MNRGYIILAVVALLLAGSAYYLLTENEDTSGETLTIWAWDPYTDVLEFAKQEYYDANPGTDIDIEIVGMGQEDMVERVKVYMSTGSLELLPDIFLDEEYNFMEYVTYFPEYVADLTDSVSPDDFLDFKTENVMKDGRIYALPYDSGTGVLFYRADYLEKAGYSEDDMRNLTWDEFIQIGKDVETATGKKMVVMCPEGDMEGRLLYYSAGTWFFDQDGNPNIKGNDGFISSFETIKKVLDSGISHNVTSWDGYINSIATESVASIVGASWWAPIIEGYADQSGLWRIAEMPRMEGYSNYSVLGGCNWFVVNNDNKDIAVDFLLSSFVNNADVANYSSNEYLLVPTNKSVLENVGGEPDEFFGGQNVVQTIKEFNSKTQPVHYGMYTYEITYFTGESLSPYLKGEMSLDDLIDRIQSEAERISS